MHLVFQKIQEGKDYSKLDDRYDGPHLVLEQTGLNTFKIKRFGQGVNVHIKFLKIAKAAPEKMKPIVLPSTFDLEDYEQVEPPVGMTPEELIGQYVIIWWPQFKRWYPGRFVGMQGQRHLVTYFERSKDTLLALY